MSQIFFFYDNNNILRFFFFNKKTDDILNPIELFFYQRYKFMRLKKKTYVKRIMLCSIFGGKILGNT